MINFVKSFWPKNQKQNSKMEPNLTNLNEIKLTKVKLMEISKHDGIFCGEYFNVEIVAEQYQPFFKSIEDKINERHKAHEMTEDSYTGQFNYDRRTSLYTTDPVKFYKSGILVEDYITDYRYCARRSSDTEEFKYKGIFVDIEMTFKGYGSYPRQTGYYSPFWTSLKITVCDDQSIEETVVPKEDKKYSFISISDYKTLKSVNESINESCKMQYKEDYIAEFLRSFNDKIKLMALEPGGNYCFATEEEFSVNFNLDKLSPKQIEDLHSVTNELFKGQYLHLKDERTKMTYLRGGGPPTVYWSHYKMLN